MFTGITQRFCSPKLLYIDCFAKVTVEGYAMKTSMESTNKKAPILAAVPSCMDVHYVCDLGCGSGWPRLHAGGANNI